MTLSTSSPDRRKTNRLAHSPRIKRVGARFLAILFWLAVWQVLSMRIGQEILLVSPIKAISALCGLMRESTFYLAIAGSLLRVLAGFFLGACLGTLLAAFAYALPPLLTLLKPLMHAIQATPVASFVILALIFVRSKYLSILMAFLMVFPILYTNVLTGLNSADQKLLEMARVFHMTLPARARAIYLPSIYPHFLSACALSLGMSWKAGIAAEVIGLPEQSIGGALYQAKIFFNTPELFAWTLAIILLSVALEQLMLLCIRALSRKGGRRA